MLGGGWFELYLRVNIKVNRTLPLWTEGDVANEKFEKILSETETWLGFLRNSVESPALTNKIQALRDAARDQEAQLLQVDRDIAEIKEERRSLRDIVLHLPQGCGEGSNVETLWAGLSPDTPRSESRTRRVTSDLWEWWKTVGTVSLLLNLYTLQYPHITSKQRQRAVRCTKWQECMVRHSAFPPVPLWE